MSVRAPVALEVAAPLTIIALMLKLKKDSPVATTMHSALVAAASYIHVRKLTSCATTRRASMKIVASIPTANLLAVVMTSALPLSSATEL